jgi:hypothetical protein
LDFGNKFRRVATIRIFGSFFTFTQNIHQFEYFWVLKHNKIKFKPKFGVRSLLTPAGLKKTDFQKLKNKQKKNWASKESNP